VGNYIRENFINITGNIIKSMLVGINGISIDPEGNVSCLLTAGENIAITEYVISNTITVGERLIMAGNFTQV